jgi:hypothetical protein
MVCDGGNAPLANFQLFYGNGFTIRLLGHHILKWHAFFFVELRATPSVYLRLEPDSQKTFSWKVGILKTLMVVLTGFAPARFLGHQILNLACLLFHHRTIFELTLTLTQ